MAKATLAWHWVLYGLLWCRLTQYTEDGGTNVQPDVATEWTASSDLKTYTFTLNPDARWHDGTPIDAASVVASVKRFLDPATGWARLSFFETVTDVSASATNEVTFTLSSPNAQLPRLLTGLPLQKVDSLATVETAPNGCGPYKLDDFVPNDHVTLVPNDEYWGSNKADVASLNLVTTSDLAAAVAGLRSDDIDVLFQPPFTDINNLKEEGFSIVQSPTGGTGYIIGPNNLHPPFNDPRARQALAMSIDREAIANSVFAGLATPSASPLLETDPYYTDAAPDLSYNLARAKELWNAAGVDGDTHLVYWSTPINSAFDPIGQILQASLKEIGINLELKSVDVGTWVARFTPQPKAFGAGYMVIDGFKGATPTQLVYMTPLKCDCATQDEKLTELMNAANATADPEEQKQILAQWQNEFAADSPTTIAVIYSEPLAVSSTVRGVWKDPDDTPQLQNIGLAQ